MTRRLDASILDMTLGELLAALAQGVAAELRAGDLSMIDQSASPLGPRRHRAAVRRRIQRGEGGASVIGRRHLLTKDALDAELAAITGAPKPKSAKRAELLAELGLAESDTH